MAVQEYLIDEVTNLTQPSEDLKQWKQYVEKLNLEGQRQLSATSDKSPMPFPLMNRGLMNIFECLCPTKLLVKDYDKTAIPLRVLVLIGFCHDKEYFGKIEIWYDETDIDPVVIGCDGSDKYLIARWGDELEEFSVLMDKAVKRRIEKRTSTLQKKLIETENNLKTIEQDVRLFFMGETTYLFD